MAFDDPTTVAAEYASERGLLGRRAAYRWATGPDAVEMTFEAAVETSPQDVLEVGCGPGEMAARIQGHLGRPVQAVDISPRMVALARGRGVGASLGDVQALPFADESFDAVLATWMLYHVHDPSRALHEIWRVLRPGGRMVVTTNGRSHLQELKELVELAGVGWRGHGFDERVAGQLIDEHFGAHELRDASGEIHFPDRDSVVAYVEASVTLFNAASTLPLFEVPFVVTRAPLVYIAVRS